MVTRITWEEETQAKIRDARTKQQEAQNLMKQAQEDDKFWGEYADALEKGLSLDKERYKIHPNGHQVRLPEHFQQQSTWDSLIDIMNVSSGFLIVRDAVTILVQAGVFPDREHATNVIYSTLYSHKNHVDKVRQGVYQLKGKPTQLHRVPRRTPSKSPRQRIGTGLEQAVKKLKADNPQLTKNEVLNRLLETGFPFQGKYPKKSMAMIWVKLGYHKEGKQQSLPGVS